MAGNVGLPSVPRGLPRDLSAFLSAMVEQVRILAGAVRGAGDSRALRASEAGNVGTGTSAVGQSAVGTDQIRGKSVTSEKLADNCITTEKIAMGAVNERAIAADAVSEDKLQASAVTRDKISDGAVETGALAEGVLPVLAEGKGIDGEWVLLPGIWRERPNVVMSWLETAGKDGSTGPAFMREVRDGAGHETGAWEFLSVGTFSWLCIGWRA